MMPTFSSLATPEVVITTVCGGTSDHSDGSVGSMTTLGYHQEEMRRNHDVKTMSWRLDDVIMTLLLCHVSVGQCSCVKMTLILRYEWAGPVFVFSSGDSFTVCMETITAFVDGPLAFMALYAFLQNKPYRHVTQLVLSLCQLYGDVLYFSTEFKDGCTHGPMYHPVYFWFYFVFMNILWIIIPSMCLFESWKAIVGAQRSSDDKESGKKAH